jgi:hypothetical protein
LAQGIYVKGNYAYVANRSNGLAIIELSTPTTPTLVDKYNTEASSLDISGSFAYISDYDGNNPAIDAINMKGLLSHVEYALATVLANDIKIAQNYLYALFTANGNSSIVIYNLDKFSIPDARTYINLPGTSLQSAYPYGDYLYVTEYFTGLKIFDVKNPKNPAMISSVDIDGGARGVYVSGRYAYVTSGFSNKLIILDVLDPYKPNIISNLNLGKPATSVFVYGKNAYLSAGFYGVIFVNVTDPYNPKIIGEYDLSTNTGDVRNVSVYGKYIYIPDINNGLWVADISNILEPKLIFNYKDARSGRNVKVSGNHIYLLDNNGGLLRINMEP